MTQQTQSKCKIQGLFDELPRNNHTQLLPLLRWQRAVESILKAVLEQSKLKTKEKSLRVLPLINDKNL